MTVYGALRSKLNNYIVSNTNRSLTITTRLFARPCTISQTSPCRGSSQDVTDVTLKFHRDVHGCSGAGRIKFAIAETRYRWARSPCERITFLIYFYDDEDSKFANVSFYLSLSTVGQTTVFQSVSQSVSQLVSQAHRQSVGQSVCVCLCICLSVGLSVSQSVRQTGSLQLRSVGSVS